MNYIWTYLKRYPKYIVIDLVMGMSSVLINLGLPTIFAYIIDKAIIPEDTQLLYRLGALMLAVIVAGAAGRIMLSYVASKLTTLMIKDMRNDLYDKVQLFSHHEYEQIGVSSLVTRITNDAFVLMQFAEMSLRLGVISPMMFIGSIIMIILTSPSLAWFMLAALPILAFVIYFIAKKSRPLSEVQQTSLDNINQYARENLMGLRVIRAFTREKFQEDRFKNEVEDYASISGRLFKLMGVASPAFFHIIIWMIVLIFWFALKPIEAGELQVGNLVAFIEYVFHALYSFLMFSNMFMMYPRMSVSAKRLEEIMDMPISIEPNLDGITETENRG